MKLDQELRIEALRAATQIAEPNLGAFGNLLAESQMIYEWLKTGEVAEVERAAKN